MKTRVYWLVPAVIGFIMFQSFYTPASKDKSDEYIVIGWNDLGMHCANQDFSKLAILPPYNNLNAQVIKRGTDSSWPEVINYGLNVTYEVPGNAYSVGKTNFWDYEDQLFGVTLPDNTGLTGAGLSGDMEVNETHYMVEGIPLTPYTDNNLSNEDPYQLALLSVYDDQNILLATTQPVIPVSNEINCVSSGCHNSEMNILYEHEDEGGFNPNDTPILCAECHADNALGTPGTPGLGSLSYVVHNEHKNKTNDCYKCHPGPETQCHRGIMNQQGMVCQDCHGSVAEVAQSIQNGREPWLEEPNCGAIECHGPDYAEEPGKLFRQSKGHGGLYCSACHGSPHAILPGNDRDNVQNIDLQGFAGILQKCSVCHGITPTAAGPHGIFATDVEEYQGTLETTGLVSIAPNPASDHVVVTLKLDAPTRADLDVYNLTGQKVVTLIKKRFPAGQYQVEVGTTMLDDGIYLFVLNTAETKSQQKVIISR